MASDKVFSEALKLKRLAVVLADEVAEACLSETYACAQLRRESPFEFSWVMYRSARWIAGEDAPHRGKDDMT